MSNYAVDRDYLLSAMVDAIIVINEHQKTHPDGCETCAKVKRLLASAIQAQECCE